MWQGGDELGVLIVVTFLEGVLKNNRFIRNFLEMQEQIILLIDNWFGPGEGGGNKKRHLYSHN